MESITLFGLMLALAAMPSSSVALVVARSATMGVKNGLAVSAGIVLGDMVFVALAILGMSVIAETMGSFFAVIKLLGGMYLLWLGFSLIKSKQPSQIEYDHKGKAGNLVTSFLAGFILTLGDIKAIIFYASLLPLFIDLTRVAAIDVFTILFITIVSVGSVKAGYAYYTHKVMAYAKSSTMAPITKKTVGGLIIGAGGYLIIKG